MNRLFTYLEGRPAYQLVALSLFLVLFMAFIDYVTGPDLSVFTLYLIPVFLGAWFVGTGTGVVLSFLSALAWTLTDILSSRIRTDVFSIIPYWNLAMELGFFLVILSILSILKTSLEQEKQMARTDYLTGAVNGRYFRELAETEINRARRYRRPFTAVYIDIDNFKTINDRLGHHAGDTLLQLAVKTIRDAIRVTDIIARVGGDEFALLLPETGLETAQKAVDKIRLRLNAVMAEKSWPATFSFGMVTFQDPPESVDHMIRLADKLMYVAKNEGKNAVRHETFGKR